MSFKAYQEFQKLRVEINKAQREASLLEQKAEPLAKEIVISPGVSREGRDEALTWLSTLYSKRKRVQE